MRRRRYRRERSYPTRSYTPARDARRNAFSSTFPGLIPWLIQLIRRLLFGGGARKYPPPRYPKRIVAPLSMIRAGESAAASEGSKDAASVPEELPYVRAPHLLSKGERALWHPLFRAVRGKYRIFCKVRLADVICCPRERADEQRWFRRIGRYHVDFVICDPETTQPLLVVELDDKTHRSRPRAARDQFKDASLRAAGVPVYRIRAEAAYDPIVLADDIERLIQPM